MASRLINIEQDWMYDMKKDDAKQNAASGCSMVPWRSKSSLLRAQVGTVTNCDDCQAFLGKLGSFM